MLAEELASLWAEGTPRPFLAAALLDGRFEHPAPRSVLSTSESVLR